MKQLTTLLVFLFFANVNAQQITWEKTFYGPVVPYNSCVSLSQLADSGFIALSNHNGQTFGGQLIRTNKFGDSTWVKYYEPSTSLITTYDNGFVLAGKDAGFAFIRKLNNMGDTVWKMNYPYANASCVKQAKDSGYILCGNNYILKTDSLGNVIWTTPCVGNFINAIVCYDDDILAVGGWNNNYATILLDKYGAVKWTKYYGTILGSNNYHYIKNAVQLADSNFATINYSCQYTPVEGWDYMKIDKNNGDTIVTRSFAGSCPSYLNMSFSKDSNLFICTDEFIKKITTTGVELWNRTFSWNYSFENITSCNDNGLAVAGNYWYYNQPGSGFYSSICMKLDSLGKFGSTQGLAYDYQQTLSVYPNPVVNKLEITNLKFSTNREVTITIYDMLGKQKLKEDFTVKGEGKIEMDVAGLSNGIYTLQVVQGSDVWRSKFVKE